MSALLLAAVFLQAPAETAPRPSVVLVVGAGGEAAYEEAFARWAKRWRQAAEQGGAKLLSVGSSEAAGEQTDREKLQAILQAESAKENAGELWLVLLGHGSYDRRRAKFNLRGPDVSATEIKQWLQTSKRSVAVIVCASSSGPFVNKLSAPNRIVISAVKSGYEQNYSRFGDYFSQALLGLEADLDKDQQVSLLEAFLAGSRGAQEFYENQSRLATEHALLDDNGDQKGSPASLFQGVRSKTLPADGAVPDGIRSHQWRLIPSDQERNMSTEVRAKRDALEQRLEALRPQKKALGEEEYYRRLEKIVTPLAELYEANGGE